jgi:hypothetical protein
LLYLPQYSPDLNPIEIAVQQIQGIPAQGCQANSSLSPPGHPLVPAPQCARMCQLLKVCGLCCSMTGKPSSSPYSNRVILRPCLYAFASGVEQRGEFGRGACCVGNRRVRGRDKCRRKLTARRMQNWP